MALLCWFVSPVLGKPLVFGDGGDKRGWSWVLKVEMCDVVSIFVL